MDERYWMVSDCLSKLRDMTSPYLTRLELEVKFLQLRVEVLQSDSGVTYGVDLMPLKRLDLLLQEFIATGYAKESSRKICLTIDELLGGLREKAAKRQMEKFIAGASSS